MTVAVRRLRRHAVHGALIVVLSDFRQATDEDKYDLTDLARDKDLCLVHVHDPLERRLPDAVPLTFWTTRGTTTIAADDAGARRRHAEAFTGRRQRIETLCREIGARHMSLATEDLPLPALIDWSRHGGRRPVEVQR